MIRVLVTGFGAFPGARSNPTVEIVRRLKASRRFARLGISVDGCILPVAYDAIAARLNEAIASHQPQAIIHLGLAARRKALCVETRALNRIGQLRPDATRRISETRFVASGGPFIRRARWPAARLASAMRASGAATGVSIDAGDYLCNQLLYATLAQSRVPAGFIHVPRIQRPKPLRASSAANNRRPSLAAMTRAVEAAILVMAIECRRQAT